MNCERDLNCVWSLYFRNSSYTYTTQQNSPGKIHRLIDMKDVIYINVYTNIIAYNVHIGIIIDLKDI